MIFGAALLSRFRFRSRLQSMFLIQKHSQQYIFNNGMQKSNRLRAAFCDMLLLRRGLTVNSKMGILYQKCMALIVTSCLGMNCVATDIGVMRFMCVAPAAHFFILGGLYVNIATDPYETLGVKENADIKECTDAYKKLAKKYHPDLNPNDAIAREAMKEINQAYDAIKKSVNKSHCDESQSAASAGKTQSSNNYNTQRSASYHSEKSQNSTSAKSKTTHNSAKSQKPNTGTNIKHETFSIYTYPNYSKNKYRSYTVFSLALFAGCIYLLLEYVIKYCTYENLLNFFTAPFGGTDYIPADLSRRESNAIWFKATDFRVCCVKILVNPKGLTAFYALPTQKSFCFKLLAPKTVSAWMNFCF